MFAPNGNSADPDVLTEDDCGDRNNYRSASTIHSSSSFPNNNNKRKRKLVFSEYHITKDQQQNQVPSIRGSRQMPTGVFLNSNSNASQRISIEDGASSAAGFVPKRISPLFQSASRIYEIAFSRAEGVPAAAFGQGKSNGSIPSATTAAAPMNDQLQQLLLNFQNASGTEPSASNTPNHNMRHRSINGMQSNNINDNDNADRFSILSQQQRQQSETFLPPISMESNNDFPTSGHTAPFQSGSTFLDPHFNNSKELLRNIQLQKQQTMEQASVLARLINNNNNAPFQVSSNSILVNQALMPNDLVRLSTDASAPHNFTLPSNELQSSRIDRTARGDPGDNFSLTYNCDAGRSKPLFLSCDAENLSDYQCLLRKQIELFDATEEDVRSSTKGRNKPIFLGQVGVRCIYCRSINPELRVRGATYYPSTLEAMYQSGQTMAIRHLRHHCMRVPFHVRERLFILKDGKSSAGGGKKYWSDAASVMGVYVSDEGGLKFRPPSAASSRTRNDDTSSNGNGIAFL